jgi:predicted transcriptional regulator
MLSTYITCRSKYEIAYDILRIVNDNPITKRRHKTGIGYAAGLTHWLTVKYLRGANRPRIIAYFA